MYKKKILRVSAALLLALTLTASLSVVQAASLMAWDKTEVEPNNTYQSATRVEDDWNNYGTISSASDVDWWVIKFTYSGNVNFFLGDIPAGCDYDMWIFGSNGISILKTAINSGNANELVTLNVSANTDYYIKIYAPFSNYSNSKYIFRARQLDLPLAAAQNKYNWCWAASSVIVARHNRGIALSTNCTVATSTDNCFSGHCGTNASGQTTLNTSQRNVVTFVKGNDHDQGGSWDDTKKGLDYAVNYLKSVGYYSDWPSVLSAANFTNLRSSISTTDMGNWALGYIYDDSSAHVIVFQKYEYVNGDYRYTIYDPYTNTIVNATQTQLTTGINVAAFYYRTLRVFFYCK